MLLHYRHTLCNSVRGEDLSLSLVYIFRYFYNIPKFKKLYLPVYNTLLYTWSNTLDRRGVVIIISQRDRLNMSGWFGCEISTGRGVKDRK